MLQSRITSNIFDGFRKSENSEVADIQTSSFYSDVNATSNSGWNRQTGWGEINIERAFEQLLKRSINPVADLRGHYRGLDRIGAPEVWAGTGDFQGATGAGALVAVIDTGVDKDHIDLAANIWRNPHEIAGDGIDNDGNGYIDDVHGWDFVDEDNDASEAQGTSHGTHVAGTIASVNNGYGQTGVAYDAKILPIRVLGPDGGYSSDVAAGIRYAAELGADAINLSLNGSGFNQAMYSAIRYATRLGSVVVMAAGNSGKAEPGYPARYANEFGLAVGAVDAGGNLAGFSNRAGSEAMAYVTAPGISVYSTVPNDRYASYIGTSMATPHVAGAVALLRSYDPSLSVSQIVGLLTSSASNAPIYTLREADGTASLWLDSNNRYRIGEEKQLLRSRQGRQFSDQNTPNWDAIAVETQDEGYRVLLAGQRRQRGRYRALSVDENGIITSGTKWHNPRVLFDWESYWQRDFTGDGKIGHTYSAKVTSPNGLLWTDSLNRYRIGEAKLLLKSKRGRTFADQNTPNWDAIAVEAHGEGYQVLLAGQRHQRGRYRALSVDENGIITSGTKWHNPKVLFDWESYWQRDFTGDGKIGHTYMAKGVSPNGLFWTDSLNRYRIGEAKLLLKSKRGKTFADQNTLNWDAIAVEAHGEGYQVLLQGQRRQRRRYRTLSVDESGVITGGTQWRNRHMLFDWESQFHVDLNGDQALGKVVASAAVADMLTGSSAHETLIGRGDAIDMLTGGGGNDIFALATPDRMLYATAGVNDYALVTDFAVGSDRLQLREDKNYVFDFTSQDGYVGLGIYWDKDASNDLSEGDDLLALVSNVVELAPTQANIRWV
ncbi:MAG: S8 family serine peptidase [Cyanobacteria bacterium P01_H01_bin.58]